MSDAAIAATKRFGEIVNTGALDAFPESKSNGRRFREARPLGLGLPAALAGRSLAAQRKAAEAHLVLGVAWRKRRRPEAVPAPTEAAVGIAD